MTDEQVTKKARELYQAEKTPDQPKFDELSLAAVAMWEICARAQLRKEQQCQ